MAGKLGTKCKRCGGSAKIYNDGPGGKGGSWVAECNCCSNAYYGCDVRAWTVAAWNKQNK
jgi:hypothetical protein